MCLEFDRIRVRLQVLDMRLEPAVLALYLFELLRKGMIFATLGAVGDDSVRSEECVDDRALDSTN